MKKSPFYITPRTKKLMKNLYGIYFKALFFFSFINANSSLSFSSPNLRLDFEYGYPQAAYQELSDGITYRDGLRVEVQYHGEIDGIPLFRIRLNGDEKNRAFTRTFRPLEEVRKYLKGFFEQFQPGDQKILVAAIGGLNRKLSIVDQFRSLGYNAWGTDIYLFPEQKLSPFVFQADLRATHLKPDQLDAIIMTWGPLTFSRMEVWRREILIEMRRILKPGGKLFVGPVFYPQVFEKSVEEMGGWNLKKTSSENSRLATYTLARANHFDQCNQAIVNSP